MIADSEKTGDKGCDPGMFRSASWLSLYLLATTNCFKYVQILIDSAVWYECGSDADKILYDAFFFTHQTAKGKRIFLDRFMEWLVKGTRDVLGKFQSRNMHDRLNQTLVQMKRNKIVKDEMSSRTGNNHSDATTAQTVENSLSYVFCHTLVFAHET